MESRQRGNAAGNTNAHVAANMRVARQRLGMDLRTFAARVKEAGRAMSASALSKIENGERRVDVDDLAVIAYVLETTPAALLTPPEGTPPPTGIPAGQFGAEELSAWVRGEVKLTDGDLARYWKGQWEQIGGSLMYYESLVGNYTSGKGNPAHLKQYEDRLTQLRIRREDIRARLLALDPDALPVPRDDKADGW